MQPYQEASEEARRRNINPRNAVQAGIDLTSKMMPFLSQYVPPLLALKGLSTLNSGVGKFINAAGKSGQQPEQILDYLRNKVSPQEGVQGENERQQERAPEQQNIIQRLAPSLFQEMKNMIDQGVNPIQAATKLKRGLGIFANSIKQIENETKTDWLNIVESVFGRGNTAQPQEQQTQQQMQPGQEQQGADWSQIMQMAQQFLG